MKLLGMFCNKDATVLKGPSELDWAFDNINRKI
jgi:hypothetical protein